MKYLPLLLMFFCSVAFGKTEILNERTYNTKVYDLGGGKVRYECHAAHIHYKYVEGKFRKIDTTLSFDGINRAWKHAKASYRPAIPEYADDWFEFYNAYEGVDQAIKVRPVASHVKGAYSKTAEEGDAVLYKDAFGQGIDLKVYAYWAGIKKVICINEKPLDASKDLHFDFELELPFDAEVLKSDKTKWTMSAQALDFKDKTLSIGKNGKFSYFRKATVWDSGEMNTPVDIELYRKGGKTYLRKTITKKTLEKAVYPLYTDDTVNYYTAAGDGYVQNLYANWAICHDAETGSSNNETAVTALVQAEHSVSGNYIIRRTFLPIDTSAIDDDAEITDTALYVYVTTKLNQDNDGDDWVNVVQTFQANVDNLSNADFDMCGDAVTNPTEGAARIDLGDMAVNGYNGFVLNATGISWIDKVNATNTLLGLREGHDCINSAPANYKANYIILSTSEDTSGSKDPYLEVTTEEAETVTTSYGFVDG